MSPNTNYNLMLLNLFSNVFEFYKEDIFVLILTILYLFKYYFKSIQSCSKFLIFCIQYSKNIMIGLSLQCWEGRRGNRELSK